MREIVIKPSGEVVGEEVTEPYTHNVWQEASKFDVGGGNRTIDQRVDSRT